MAKQPDYTWLVQRRADIQLVLLDLHTLLKEQRSTIQGTEPQRTTFLLLVGTAFSLWRAVFLVDCERDWPEIVENAEQFLESVVRDNAINYPQDRRARAWTAAYYLNNARHRLVRIQRKYPHLKTLDAFQRLGQLHEDGLEEGSIVGPWNAVLDALREALGVFRDSCERPAAPARRGKRLAR